jgi:hypothetical protein
MRNRTTCLSLVALVTLAACQDNDPLAPRPPANMTALPANGCLWTQLNGVPGTVMRTDDPPPHWIGTVTVTAQYPVNEFEKYESEFEVHTGQWGSLGCAVLGLGVQLAWQPDTTPLVVPEPPENVDRNFWDALSPKERLAVLKTARALRLANPNLHSLTSGGSYDAERTEGNWINLVIRPLVLDSKNVGFYAGLDRYGATYRGAVFGASVYACDLYQRVRRNGDWAAPLSGTQEMVLELGDAFGWTYFASEPARASAVVAAMAYASGIAFADLQNSNCRTLVGNTFSLHPEYLRDPGAPQGQTPQLPPDEGGTLLRVVTPR